MDTLKKQLSDCQLSDNINQGSPKRQNPNALQETMNRFPTDDSPTIKKMAPPNFKNPSL